MNVRPAPAHELAPRAGGWFRVHGVISSALVLVFVVMLGGGAVFLADDLVVRAVAGGASALVAAVILGWYVGLKPAYLVRSWRYEITPNEVYLQRGVLVIRRTVVPLLRIENVDTAQGPIAKRFDVMSVSVSTAAGTHEIPALQTRVAEELRDRIATLAREARDE